MGVVRQPPLIDALRKESGDLIPHGDRPKGGIA